MEDQINEKLLGQLICLPQTSLLVDVKDLGYDNGAVAAMDLVRQFQVRFSYDFMLIYFTVLIYICA